MMQTLTSEHDNMGELSDDDDVDDNGKDDDGKAILDDALYTDFIA